PPDLGAVQRAQEFDAVLHRSPFHSQRLRDLTSVLTMPDSDCELNDNLPAEIVGEQPQRAETPGVQALKPAIQLSRGTDTDALLEQFVGVRAVIREHPSQRARDVSDDCGASPACRS